MFKEILRAWRGKSLLNDVLEVFDRMLEDGEAMFEAVSEGLFGRGGALPERGALYERDRRINEAEREARRMLAEHLAISHTDVGPCLVLMNTIKDAERLGDYAKNLYEILELTGAALADDAYATELRSIAATLRENFRDTRVAIRESDADLARAVIERNGPLPARCDGLIDRLIRDEIPTREAVTYTLLARFLKRTGSHLKNIASSVVLPVHQIGYTGKRPEDD